MSQVIVTHDSFMTQRAKTRDQEHHIDVDSQFDRWRRNDITKSDPVAKLIGIAVLPILALWAILCVLMALFVTIVNGVFNGLGKIVGGKRNLNRDT